MQTVVILIHLMIVLAMVGLVLIQKSEGGGLGMGGGSGGGFMSSRGTANVLTRATGILAALFFATSLFLSILASFDRKPRTILTAAARPPCRERRRFRDREGACSTGSAVELHSRHRRRQPHRPGRRCRDSRNISKGRETGPSLLGEVRCEDVETIYLQRQDFSCFSTTRAGLHGTFPSCALVESIRPA